MKVTITIESDDPEAINAVLNHLHEVNAIRTVYKPSPDIGIDGLGLTVRSANCLYAEGITTVAQLMCMSDEQLRKIPNMGERGIHDAKHALEKNGYVRCESECIPNA